jgi:hypothetical protein
VISANNPDQDRCRDNSNGKVEKLYSIYCFFVKNQRRYRVVKQMKMNVTKHCARLSGVELLTIEIENGVVNNTYVNL